MKISLDLSSKQNLLNFFSKSRNTQTKNKNNLSFKYFKYSISAHSMKKLETMDDYKNYSIMVRD